MLMEVFARRSGKKLKWYWHTKVKGRIKADSGEDYRRRGLALRAAESMRPALCGQINVLELNGTTSKFLYAYGVTGKAAS